MKELNQEPPNQDDFKGIGISFALHAVVLSYFILNTVFFPSEQIDFSQAVRVDIVALPDKKPALPAKVDEVAKPEPIKEASKPVTEPVKPVVKTPPPTNDPDAINLNKVKNQQQNALEKIKAMNALDKIRDDVKKDETEAQKKQAAEAIENARKRAQEAAQAQVKGNVLSAGSSLTGLNKLQHESYASDLDSHIKQHWALPEWLSRKEFKAQARVFIDKNGNILGRKITKSSGNPAYDEEVLATIDKSAPFPPPPEKFRDLVNIDGITIGFPE